MESSVRTLHQHVTKEEMTSEIKSDISIQVLTSELHGESENVQMKCDLLSSEDGKSHADNAPESDPDDIMERDTGWCWGKPVKSSVKTLHQQGTKEEMTSGIKGGTSIQVMTSELHGESENIQVKCDLLLNEDDKSHVDNFRECDPDDTMERDPEWGWVCLFGAFFANCIMFGVNQSFGVIYADMIDYFKAGRGETSTIGSLPLGLLFFLGPLSGLLTERYGCRLIAIAGSLITTTAFIISVFATSVTYLCITFGVAGIGMSLMFMPSVIIINQYFNKRRSFANALCSTGSGVGTTAFARLFRLLLEEYGWRGTLLIVGGIAFNGVWCGALFISPKLFRLKRHKVQGESVPEKKRCFVDFSSLRNPTYAIFVIANAISALGVFVPFVHLPRRAKEVDIEDHHVAWLISTIGIFSMAGRLLIGWIADLPCVNRLLLFVGCTTVCGTSLIAYAVFISFPFLAVLSALYGAAFGVYSYIKPVILSDMMGVHNLSKGLGVLIMFQGISAVLGAPLAGWLYDLTGNYTVSFYVAGSLFLAGSTMILLQRLVSKFRNHKGKYDLAKS